jgi:hypothetical protein
MPLAKPWQTWDPALLKKIPGTLGVFEIGDANGVVLYVGMAGGRTRFGLRERIADCFTGKVAPSLAVSARLYRHEVNMMYTTRWIELLERHQHQHGALPAANIESGESLPRLGRAGRSAARPADEKRG